VVLDPEPQDAPAPQVEETPRGRRLRAASSGPAS